MQDITIAAPFVEQALIGTRVAGYNVNEVLRSSRIAPALLTRPLARVALDDFVRLIQNLMKLMDDERVGLLSPPQRIGCFGLVARATLHETRLLDAMHCYVRSTNLLDAGLVHYLEPGADGLVLGLRRRPGTRVLSTYLIESALMTTHRYFCWLGRTRIPLLRVELDYPAPAWAHEYRHLFYGAPVIFDCEENRLTIKSDAVDGSVQQDLAALEAYIRRAPRDLFTPLASSQASQQARQIILQHFEAGQGMPRAEQVAKELGLTDQTFWRRLQREGLDYTQVRTRVRRDVAISLLGDAEMSIERIAEAVGYSESSAFIRAFRRWTGMTPMAYRKL